MSGTPGGAEIGVVAVKAVDAAAVEATATAVPTAAEGIATTTAGATETIAVTTAEEASTIGKSAAETGTNAVQAQVTETVQAAQAIDEVGMEILASGAPEETANPKAVPEVGSEPKKPTNTANEKTPKEPVDHATEAEEAPDPNINPVTPAEYRAWIAENSESLKALFGSLTPEQIKSSPILAHIRDRLGGDIDRFIREGRATGHSDKEILDAVVRAKEDAVKALGGEYVADQILASIQSPEYLATTITQEILASLSGPESSTKDRYLYLAYQIILAQRELTEAEARGASDAEKNEIQARIKKSKKEYQTFLKVDSGHRGFRTVLKESDKSVNSAEEALKTAEKSGDKARILKAQEMLEITKLHQESLKKKKGKYYLWQIAKFLFAFSLAGAEEGYKGTKEAGTTK